MRAVSLLLVLALGCNESHEDRAEDAAIGDGARSDGARSDGAIDDGAIGDGAIGDGAIGDGAIGDGGRPDALVPECTKPSDCALRSASCCGSCGAATREDSIALPVSELAAYLMRTCEGMACPGCAAIQDPTLLATCRAGACVVVDVLEDVTTECDDDDACRVRSPVCCECGGPTGPEGLLAVSTTSTTPFESLVCDPGSVCDDCVPMYAPQVVPLCAEGHCRVTFAE